MRGAPCIVFVVSISVLAFFFANSSYHCNLNLCIFSTERECWLNSRVFEFGNSSLARISICLIFISGKKCFKRRSLSSRTSPKRPRIRNLRLRKRITGNQKEEWEGYEEDIPLSPFPSCSKIPPMFSYHSSLLPTIPDTLNWYTDTWFQSSQNLLCNIRLFNKNCPAKNSYFATKTLIYGIFVANVEKNTTYAFRG